MRGSPGRVCPHLRKVLSFINFAAREINCKIVYYGAGLGGKTTNLQVIYQKTADQQKGKMISLATETERTLFFDFLPLDLGSVRGFKTRIHLYTVPGQVFYDASRKLIWNSLTQEPGYFRFAENNCLQGTLKTKVKVSILTEFAEPCFCRRSQN